MHYLLINNFNTQILAIQNEKKKRKTCNKCFHKIIYCRRYKILIFLMGNNIFQDKQNITR